MRQHEVLVPVLCCAIIWLWLVGGIWVGTAPRLLTACAVLCGTRMLSA